MKWTFTIRHKLAAAGLMAIVIGLVLMNNLTEQKNSDDLNDAFASMYEDRLLAESYILRMYGNLHEVNDLSDEHRNNPTAVRVLLAPVIAEMNNTIALYRKTKLTEEEEVEFAAFTERTAAVTACASSGYFEGCKSTSDEALGKLAILSEIQLKEGAKLIDDSQRIYSSSLSSSQFEIVVLIVIGLLIQALIFSSRTLQQGNNKKFGMN